MSTLRTGGCFVVLSVNAQPNQFGQVIAAIAKNSAEVAMSQLFCARRFSQYHRRRAILR